MDNDDNHLKKHFKNTFDKDNSKRTREELTLNARKNKRDVNLNQKRKIFFHQEETNSDDIYVSLDELASIIKDLYSVNNGVIEESIVKLRVLINNEDNTPAEEIVNSGIIPRVLELANSDNKKIVFESFWVLQNLMAVTNENEIGITNKIADLGGFPIFIKNLRNDTIEIRELSILIVGLIAGDYDEYRDYFIKNNVIDLLIESLGIKNISLIRVTTYSIARFCRGNIVISKFNTEKITNVLCVLIKFKDEDVVREAIWTLSYITANDNLKSVSIDYVVQNNMIPTMIQLLQHTNPNIRLGTLRVVGNIALGDDDQTQKLLDSNFISIIYNFFDNYQNDMYTIRELLWVISNIAGGSISQKQLLIDSNIFKRILQYLDDINLKIIKEATWCITNIFRGGSPNQMGFLIEQGILDSYCQLLYKNDDIGILYAVLDGIIGLLKTGHTNLVNSENIFAKYLEKIGAKKNIEHLMNHSTEDVFEKAEFIIENYYPNNDMLEIEF